MLMELVGTTTGKFWRDKLECNKVEVVIEV